MNFYHGLSTKATSAVFLKCLNMVIWNTENMTDINYESELQVLVEKPSFQNHLVNFETLWKSNRKRFVWNEAHFFEMLKIVKNLTKNGFKYWINSIIRSNNYLKLNWPKWSKYKWKWWWRGIFAILSGSGIYVFMRKGHKSSIRLFRFDCYHFTIKMNSVACSEI